MNGIKTKCKNKKDVHSVRICTVNGLHMNLLHRQTSSQSTKGHQHAKFRGRREVKEEGRSVQWTISVCPVGSCLQDSMYSMSSVGKRSDLIII